MKKNDKDKKLDMLLTVLYTGALANALILEEICRRLETIGGYRNYIHERKRLFGQLRDHARAMRTLYTKLEPDYDIAFTSGRDGTYDAKAYDSNMADAMELCRLMLLYWDRCFQSEENMNAVFSALRGLGGVGVFTDEDIERFRLK